MSIWQRVLSKRALLCALGPLAGERATGNVIATAAGGDTQLAAGTYGIPIIDGKATYARMLKVLPNGYGPRSAPLPWPVTASGSPVAVRAVAGGTAGNLPPGTPVLWQPYDADLVPRGLVDPAGVTGGTAASGPGTVARVIPYEAIGRGDAVRTFWEARGEGFPALCVARVGSDVVELVTVHSALRVHRFRVYVVSARLDGDDERTEELELILDAVEGTLQGLADVEGEVFSGPPVETGSEVREASAPVAHVFSMEVRVHYALPRFDVRENDGRSWAPWQTTRIRVAAPETETQASRTLVDATAEQEQ